MRVGEFKINGIEPMGAVRMTTRGKFVKANAQRYLTYKELIYRSILKQLNGVYEPIDAAISIHINFYMPIPGYWPKYKKEAAPGEFCTTKPDIDNLVKGLFDSLNGLLWVDDNRIVSVEAVKKYANNPGIEFTFSTIGELSHGQANRPQKEETKQRAKRKAESRAGRLI
jgi:Holliday junction resolvase RusA-like endonuclease